MILVQSRRVKTIGLLGGMSWTSSLEYYRRINERVQERLGGLHSAPILMFSFDFEEIHPLQHEGRWDEAGERLAAAARRLEEGGADFLVVCSNTMHKLAASVEAAVRIPLLHIADATGERVRRQGLKRVGLLGTRFTMEEAFYRDRLAERFGLDVRIPGEHDRAQVHRVIYEELCRDEIRPTSRKAFQAVAARLVRDGAEGIILGCTEIGLLLEPGDAPVPLFDTARIHAEAAADRAAS